MVCEIIQQVFLQIPSSCRVWSPVTGGGQLQQRLEKWLPPAGAQGLCSLPRSSCSTWTSPPPASHRRIGYPPVLPISPHPCIFPPLLPPQLQGPGQTTTEKQLSPVTCKQQRATCCSPSAQLPWTLPPCWTWLCRATSVNLVFNDLKFYTTQKIFSWGN